MNFLVISEKLIIIRKFRYRIIIVGWCEMNVISGFVDSIIMLIVMIIVIIIIDRCLIMLIVVMMLFSENIVFSIMICISIC